MARHLAVMTALLVAQPAGHLATKRWTSHSYQTPVAAAAQSAVRSTRIASSACDQLQSDSDVIRYDEYYQAQDCLLHVHPIRACSVCAVMWGF